LEVALAISPINPFTGYYHGIPLHLHHIEKPQSGFLLPQVTPAMSIYIFLIHSILSSLISTLWSAFRLSHVAHHQKDRGILFLLAERWEWLGNNCRTRLRFWSMQIPSCIGSMTLRALSLTLFLSFCYHGHSEGVAAFVFLEFIITKWVVTYILCFLLTFLRGTLWPRLFPLAYLFTFALLFFAHISRPATLRW